MNERIHIEDIGPVKLLDYELRDYGVHVLRGFNGCGKSSTLRAVQLITDSDSDVKPTKRDGTKRGEATVCGKTLRVTEKRSAFDGELTVEGLENLSIVDLHSPKYEKVQTRDAHRIKTLCRIAGAKADISLFHDLLGGKDKFEQVIPRDSMSTDDLVKMSQMVKSAIEREGRRIEELERSAKADALAQQTIAGGVDHALPHDDAVLQQTHLRAVAKHAELKEKRRAYKQTVKAADEARERLKGLSVGKSVEEARAELEAARDARQEAADNDRQAFDAIQNLEQLLREAKLARETTKAKFDAADRAEIAALEALTAAGQAVEARDALDAAIEAAGSLTEITEEQVDDAAEAVGTAAEAVSKGFEVRQAIAAESKAKDHLDRAKGHASDAQRLRDAAAEVSDVLTRAIETLPGCPLRIKIDSNGDARLVTTTSRGPDTPYDDLSDGEKWLIVLGVAVGKNRLVVMPQQAFEGLSRTSQAKLHEAAKAAEAFVLTAHVADCELCCVPFNEQKATAAE